MDAKNWGTLQSNLVQAKAKCGVAVMKQYYYATCLAALVSSATNSTVSGDTTNPKVTISNDACNGYKSKCTDYFTSLNKPRMSNRMLTLLTQSGPYKSIPSSVTHPSLILTRIVH
jgi:guanyl-specific ribonuclease Sa